MGEREKKMKDMVKRLREAGCEVEPHPGSGCRWIVTTPNGERVVMGGLAVGKEEPFVAYLRRLGVDIRRRR